MKAIDAAMLNILTLDEDEPINKAVELFRKFYLDALPIINRTGHLSGIFTRSNIYKVFLDNMDKHLPVKEVMVRDVLKIRYDEYIDFSLSLGNPKGQVVVVDEDNRPIGMINRSTTVQVLLNQSNALAYNMSSLVDTMEYGVINVNRDGIVTVFNKVAAQLLGAASNEVIGKSISKAFPYLGVDRVLTDGQPIVGQRHTVGKHIFLENCRLVNGPDGWFGAVVILQDTTSLEQITQELNSVKQLNNTLDTVLDIAYDGIVVVNDKGIITLINNNMCQLLGFEEVEVIGRHISDVRENSKLHIVAETGIAELHDIQKIKGTRYAVSCVPVIENGQPIGAVEKITFVHVKQAKEFAQKVEFLEKEINSIRQETRKAHIAKYTFKHIISHNQQMELAKREAQRVAHANLPVVILGPSGTGKELFAHSIHNASPRRMAPFIKVNCAAIPEELMESEFFGYEEGAFTGAKQKGKAGKFELANGGTLFLDEIGDMPPSLQVKLLRVLQDGEFERIGGTEPKQVNVRIIAATHNQLDQMVKEGKFRLDLYYRINVFTLNIPSLSNRREDIPHLVNFFINKFNAELSTQVSGIQQEALKALKAYNWPGNVRELENIIRRAVYLLDGDIITLKDIPVHISGQQIEDSSDIVLENETVREIVYTPTFNDVISYEDSLEERERELILQALQQAAGNRSKAAKLMGIGRSTLYEKMTRLGIPTAKKEKSEINK